MMYFSVPLLTIAAPEMLLLAMVCIVLMVDVYLPVQYRAVSYYLSQASLVLVALLCIALFPDQPLYTFSNTFVLDPLAATLKTFVLVVGYFALFYIRFGLEQHGLLRGEYYVLGLFAILGMMVLISANSLLTIYLGLELLSLSLYTMVALNRDSAKASEAAIKYFVLGSLASGILLYGMSMLYGATGSLDLSIIHHRIATDAIDHERILTLGLVMVVIGIAFKLGAVPFHMWIPDVYEGASTPITLFIATAPKIAAFGMLMRLLVDGLGGLQVQWGEMLSILAVASIAIGNVIAIAQTNIKRMLGYSTIAHVGFLFLGVISGTSVGYSASLFYILVYAMMAMGGFALVIVLDRKGFECSQIDDFRGLNERSPWFACMMLILMLSMAGMPPLLGFWAKWSVLQSIIAVDRIGLAVIAVVFSVIGLFYYLRICRLMYFESPSETAPVAVASNLRVVVTTNALIILALGIYPGALLSLCKYVIT